MRVLVTGGAGYIGSHTVVRLVEAGYEPIIVDNFSNSKRIVGDRLNWITDRDIVLHEFDLRDTTRMDALFASEQIDAVIHFAGLKSVGESVATPLQYYQNNLDSTLELVRAMLKHKVSRLIFSSSATVYGADAVSPMAEDLPTSATNPYGWSKVMIEQVLRDVAAANPLLSVALLRYFNPVGAHPSALIGEDPLGIPSNLVPYIAQVAAGRLDKLSVFGDDYPTPDGTCVRDYIHVDDLAAGHVAALAKLANDAPGVHTWNLGTGRGTSVLEMLRAFESVVGRDLPFEVVGRRQGDVAVSFADPLRASLDLGWTAKRTVDQMCEDTWRWQSSKPDGYPAETRVGQLLAR
jgi:UDP-glucose 4-epimerase